MDESKNRHLLAVAAMTVGLGAALFNGMGSAYVAHADDAPSSGSTGEVAGPAPSAESPSTPVAVVPPPATDAGSAPSTPAAAVDSSGTDGETAPSSTTTIQTAGTTVTAQTNGGTSTTTAPTSEAPIASSEPTPPPTAEPTASVLPTAAEPGPAPAASTGDSPAVVAPASSPTSLPTMSVTVPPTVAIPASSAFSRAPSTANAAANGTAIDKAVVVEDYPGDTANPDPAPEDLYTAPSPVKTLISTLVYNAFDAANAFLGGLPANPFSQFLQGALLLVRRAFFDQPPTLTPIQTTGQVDGQITGTVGGVDPEGETITYAVIQNPLHGSVVVNADGTYVYTPGEDFHGKDVFRVLATDGDMNANVFGRDGDAEANIVVTQGPDDNLITFAFSYVKGEQYWTKKARASLDWASKALSTYFIVDKPVTITIAVSGGRTPYLNPGPKETSQVINGLGSGTLAFASSPRVNDEDDGFYDTVVQQKIRTGVDANGDAPDGATTVNFAYRWAFGQDIAANEWDLSSTMMHELLHAFGFTDGFSKPGSNSGENWSTYDQFVGTSGGTRVIDPTSYDFDNTYSPNITGGNDGLYFLGPKAMAAYGGQPVKLYTPEEYDGGSAISHLDDDTFNDADPDSLNAKKMMNHSDGTGPNPRRLSLLELGMLSDLGYAMEAS